MMVGGPTVVNEPVVARDRIKLPPLNITLGLMKQNVTVLNKGVPCVEFIAHMLPGLTMDTIKAEIEDRPQ